MSGFAARTRARPPAVRAAAWLVPEDLPWYFPSLPTQPMPTPGPATPAYQTCWVSAQGFTAASTAPTANTPGQDAGACAELPTPPLSPVAAAMTTSCRAAYWTEARMSVGHKSG